MLTSKDQLNFYTADAQYAEDIGAYSSAYLGQNEAGRLATLPTYTSNQSKPEAAPWSVLRLLHDEGQILPDSIDDKDLSSFAHMSGVSPIEVLSVAKVEPANPSRSERYHCSRRKPQNYKRGLNPREVTRNNLRAGSRHSSAAGHPAVSPATSTASINSAPGKGRRQEGSHLPEEDRKSANEVREQGACFRCWVMKEKVCN
jgi:hypothetical protein